MSEKLVNFGLYLMLVGMVFLVISVLMSGCASQQVVKSVKVEKMQIPNELLTLKGLEKPSIKTELDILNAYSSLFYAYKQCEIKIDKIKELNNGK